MAILETVDNCWYRVKTASGYVTKAFKTFAKNVYMDDAKTTTLLAEINDLKSKLSTAESKITELEGKDDYFDTYLNFRVEVDSNNSVVNHTISSPTSAGVKYTATTDCWIRCRFKYSALGGYAPVYIRDENNKNVFVYTATCGGSYGNNHDTPYFPMKAGWKFYLGSANSLSSGVYSLVIPE